MKAGLGANSSNTSTESIQPVNLFRLSLATILHRKVWFVWLVLALVFPLVMPYMTPWEQDATILQPARAQAAWLTLWAGALTWGLFQGAGFGEALARRGLGEYFTTQGVSKWSQLAQTWCACFIAILPLLASALVICLVWAMPGEHDEAIAWVWLLVQYAVLFVLTFGALLVLAIALGTRLGLASGYLLVFGLALYGLYGVSFLDLFVRARKDAVLETIWTFSPHYHLSSDLTERLIFKSGSLPWGDFWQVFVYLAGLFLIHLGISFFSFKSNRA